LQNCIQGVLNLGKFTSGRKGRQGKVVIGHLYIATHPPSRVIGMNERDLRKLLEKIEIKYLHLQKIGKLEKNFGSHSSAPITFKLTASQKYPKTRLTFVTL
jgi:hypothetical protein